jgi:cellulose biosynthesis protein BcsQ
MPVALEPVPPTPPVVVIAHDDPGTADSLRHAVDAAGWQALLADPSIPGLAAAALAAGPSVAVVACAVLANLPPDCPVPLIAIGDDDRAADVKAALVAGARSLLAWPDGAADLPGELARVAAGRRPAGVPGGMVVAVRGVQGGAGATTLAIHLAAAWARWGPAPVLLVDLAGGLAFRLDLGTAATWSSVVPPTAATVPAADMSRRWTDGSSPEATAAQEASAAGGLEGQWSDGSPLGAGAAQGLPAPGLDGDMLVGTLAEPWAGLSVLPLAGLADGVPDPLPEPSAVRDVLEVAASTYSVVVVDLPATGGPPVETALALADFLVAVGRCETAGVRGLQAALSTWAAAGGDPDAAGAVVTGVRPRAPLAAREVRAALGVLLWALVPAASAELAAAAEDGVLLLDRHDLSAVQAMVTLANRVVPFTAVSP